MKDKTRSDQIKSGVKKCNIVILWSSQAWEWLRKIFESHGQNVYQLSLRDNLLNTDQVVFFKSRTDIPVPPNEVDYVIFAGNQDDVSRYWPWIPRPANEKVITIQNWFRTKGDWGKYKIAVKWHIVLSAALKRIWMLIDIIPWKSSPVSWIARGLHKILETTPWPYSNFLTWEFDSITVLKFKIKKAIINTVINSICVLLSDECFWYTKNSIDAFGWEKLESFLDEVLIVQFNMSSLPEGIFPSKEEILSEIHNIYSNLWSVKPSLWYDFYWDYAKVKFLKYWNVFTSEYNYLLWAIIEEARKKGIYVPISEDIHRRIMFIVDKIKSS